jgi:hypothetical protein
MTQNNASNSSNNDDQLFVLVTPEQADVIRTREDVVNQYCVTNGLTRDEVTQDIQHVLAIRALPEWKNASA